jgi:hypothetical protein
MAVFFILRSGLPYISWIAAWGNESDTAIGTNYVSNRYTNTSSNTGFTGWQYTSKGSIAGITGYVDTDCFYGWSGTNSSNTSGQSVGRADTEPYIEYQAKCQNTGWIASVTEPNTAGTTGRGLGSLPAEIDFAAEQWFFLYFWKDIQRRHLDYL